MSPPSVQRYRCPRCQKTFGHAGDGPPETCPHCTHRPSSDRDLGSNGRGVVLERAPETENELFEDVGRDGDGDGDADGSLEERVGEDRPVWRFFKEYGTQEKGYLGLGLVTSLIGRIALLLPPLILGFAIDLTFSESVGLTAPLIPAAWLPATQSGQLVFFGGAIAAAFLSGYVASVIAGFSLTLFGQRVMHRIRSDGYRKVQYLDMSFFDDMQIGDIMSILNNDVERLRQLLDKGVDLSLQAVFMTGGITVVLLLLHWQLALVTLIAVPLVVVLTAAFVRVVQPRVESLRAQVGQFNAQVQNNLSGAEVIKSTGTEDHEVERIQDASEGLFHAWWKFLRLGIVYMPSLNFIGGVSFAVTFLVGGFWILGITPLFTPAPLTIGTFVTFLLLSQRVTQPLTQMGQVFYWHQDARASSKRILGLMDMERDIEDRPDAQPLHAIDGHVVFEQVDFGYQEGTPVLKGIDLEVQPGETIGVVGPTGAGKSTLIKLLLRLYDPDEGRVVLDDRDIRDISVRDLRSRIGYVSQDPFLFDGTVRDNIRYASFDASMDDIVEAAKAAAAHDFIQNLPEGYDTRVGERGVKLSGGQRQRVCVARTLLQDPDLWLLDEATSDVDTETELLIQNSLDTFSRDKTTFIVAHRLSTIKEADRILALEDGEIVEMGSHEELLAKDEGLYANLWNIQLGDRDKVSEDFYELIRSKG